MCAFIYVHLALFGASTKNLGQETTVFFHVLFFCVCFSVKREWETKSAVLQIISIFAAHLTGKVKRSKQSKNHRNVMFHSREQITMCFNYIYSNTVIEEVYWLLLNIIRCEMWQTFSFHFFCRLDSLHFYSMFIDIVENMKMLDKHCGGR